MSLVETFLTAVQTQYATGIAREHAYRPALHDLIAGLHEAVNPVNDPSRTAIGAPDFIVLKNEIEIGHIEAKDIDIDLRKMKGPNKDQQERYRKGFDNLIYTNCLDWDFYIEGELVASVTIADLLMGLQPKPETFQTLENLLKEFITRQPQTITSPDDLARRMAGKAGVIKDVFANALREDDARQTELAQQYEAFKENLIHDITPEDFADIYAETIAYGMFAARLHDPTVETFSRQEAWELIPKSNPFLRDLFLFVAGPNLDSRLRWIIDELARVFLAADLKGKIMANFGSLTGRADPFLHFYETFLAAYNPKKRKARGVWYTPEAVVSFIVRAVDDVLKSEFGIPDGLADSSKITVDWETGQTDKKGRAETIKKEVHRVQVLDPATGTGTFLAEVIKLIAPRIQGIAPAHWSQYVEDHLIPRLHGFELLMASYAMCHMKLDMILTELGYTPTGRPSPDGAQRRLSVYLTNSLEEGEPANQQLPFTQWLSREAKGANTIKRDMPIMCVIGNPPYLGEGGVSEGWIGDLMEDYKKEPGGKVKLKERNPKWLNDLYVKFIRMSSHLIEKNGSGVLGFITNHGYLDNPTFRGMRWHLLKTFSKIYVLDLHGNSKKKEVAPDGGNDVNVFDIMQGVSIIIGVKHAEDKSELAEVYHGDLWGPRKAKYEALRDSSLSSEVFEKIETPAPQHPLVKRDFEKLAAYDEGFAVSALMPVSSVGIVTARDSLTIDMDKEALWNRVQDFARLEPEQARIKYNLGKDVQDWSVSNAQADLKNNFSANNVTRFAYRPFDSRWTYYTGTSRGFMCRPRADGMRHLLLENIALCSNSQTKDGYGGFVVNSIGGHKIYGAYDINTYFPLYLYPDEQDLDQSRRVNFEPKLWKKLQKLAKHPEHGTPDEVQTFDYIYGVLHSPAYRETYAEFLKIDFPRIPWPSTPEAFWDISAKGSALRALHLMQPEAVGEAPYPFMSAASVEGADSGEADGVVGKPRFEEGKVWINEVQYFDNAPEVSWGFFIGGYQPAQKWLKDRKGRALSYDDIRHYQQILKILSETDRIMKTIEMDL